MHAFRINVQFHGNAAHDQPFRKEQRILHRHLRVLRRMPQKRWRRHFGNLRLQTEPAKRALPLLCVHFASEQPLEASAMRVSPTRNDRIGQNHPVWPKQLRLLKDWSSRCVRAALQKVCAHLIEEAITFPVRVVPMYAKAHGAVRPRGEARQIYRLRRVCLP